MKSMKSLVAIIVVLSLTAAQAVTPARADDVTTEIKKLTAAYDAAIKAHDTKALDRLYDKDGIFISSKGQRLSKSALVAQGGDKTVVYKTVKATPFSFQGYGDTVIENGDWVATGTEKGKPFEWRLRYTTVWVKKGGAWVITVDHVTAVTNASTNASYSAPRIRWWRQPRYSGSSSSAWLFVPTSRMIGSVLAG